MMTAYTRTPGNTATPKISFPATLDNGEAPDTALPFGTSIQTEFKAENTAGSDEIVSNVVTPSPSCISGPIILDNVTAVSSDGNTLTFVSTKDFDKLEAGDELIQNNSGATLPLLNCSYQSDFNTTNSDSTTATLQVNGGPVIQEVAGRTGAHFTSIANNQDQSLWYSDWNSVNWTSTDVYVSAWLYIENPGESARFVGQDTSGDGQSFTIFGIGGGYFLGTTITPPINKWIKAEYIHSPSTNTRKWAYDNQKSPVQSLSGVNLSSHPTMDVGVRKRHDGNSKVRADFYISDLVITATPVPTGDVVTVDDDLKQIAINDRIGNFLAGNFVTGPDYTCPPITLDADDPDDVEKFYAIKAALVQYESERIDFQQLMVDALVAAGFTTDQIAAYIDE